MGRAWVVLGVVSGWPAGGAAGVWAWAGPMERALSGVPSEQSGRGGLTRPQSRQRGRAGVWPFLGLGFLHRP